MTTGAELLRGLADKISLRDLFEGQTPRQVADDLGLPWPASRSSVWRALRGDSKSPKWSRGEAFRNRRAAEAFRRKAEKQIRVGKVRVSYFATGRPEGYRTIPAVDLDDPEEIASAIEDGDYEAAADALNAQIMYSYGATDTDGEGVYLEIADWPPDLFD